MENFKIESILHPTDLSKLSESALKTAVEICKRQQAKLTLFHVADKVSMSDNKGPLVPPSEAKVSLITWIHEELKAIAAKITQESQIEIKVIVDTGEPADAICELANKDRYSMVVIGTHGHSGFREHYMGSTAYRVVKNAPCPVLSVQGDWDRHHFKKIVYPIRRNQKVFEKYNYIVPIIEQNNSEVIIAGLADKDKPDHISETVFSLDLLRNMCREEHIPYTTIMLPCDNYSKKLIETASRKNADLIVISANIDNTLEEFYIGPFAQQMVNQAKCPVLSIRPSFREIK